VSLRLSESIQRKTEIRQRKHRNATVAEIIEDYLKACEANDRNLSATSSKGLAGGKTDQKTARSIIKDDIEGARLELAQGRFPGFRHKAELSLNLLTPTDISA
jgi:hypothetical protein